MATVGPSDDDMVYIALYDAQRGILVRSGAYFRRLPNGKPFTGSPFAELLARLDGPHVRAFTDGDRPRLTPAGDALLREVRARRHGSLG